MKLPKTLRLKTIAYINALNNDYVQDLSEYAISCTMDYLPEHIEYDDVRESIDSYQGWGTGDLESSIINELKKLI